MSSFPCETYIDLRNIESRRELALWLKKITTTLNTLSWERVEWMYVILDKNVSLTICASFVSLHDGHNIKRIITIMEKRFAETFSGGNFRQKYFWYNDKLGLNTIKTMIVLLTIKIAKNRKCSITIKFMVIIYDWNKE